MTERAVEIEAHPGRGTFDVAVANNDETTDWKTGCGKSARPVGGRGEVLFLAPTPIF